QHLDAMLALCETVECRRQQLLAYFGETAEPCGNCDTCLTPPETWDGTIAAQKVLSTVFRLDRERRQRFGAGQIVDILLGRQTPKVQQHRHDQLTVFGVGTELTEAEWRAVIRQLLAQGLLGVEGDYQVFTLTEASRPVLRSERQVLLRKDPPRQARSRSSRSAGSRAEVELSPEAAPLFERLRAWRGSVAREQGLPAYVIFHDATLREIAARRPGSLAELGSISGIGESKLAKYGDQVLEVLEVLAQPG